MEPKFREYAEGKEWLGSRWARQGSQGQEEPGTTVARSTCLMHS